MKEQNVSEKPYTPPRPHRRRERGRRHGEPMTNTIDQIKAITEAAVIAVTGAE